MQLSQEQEINRLIELEVAKFIRNLPNRVREILNGAIISALGLAERYSGHYEIDHCNGREPLIGHVIKEQCITLASKMTIDIAEKALKNIKNDKLFVKAILVEADRLYRSQMRTVMTRLVQEKVVKDAEELLTKLTKVHVEKVNGTLHDIANPDCGSRPVEEALLEQIASNFISREEIVCDS